jgi:putative transposase
MYLYPRGYSIHVDTATQRPQTRSEKGQDIVWTKGAVRKVDENTYVVQSQSFGGEYMVISTEGGWVCSCPDNTYRRVECKHLIAVKVSIELRREVQSYVTVVPEVTSISCRYCSSENIVKKARRQNKYGAIQRYLCKECGKRFSFNIGFEKMQATPQMITGAMQLYFSGESLRNVQKFLKLQGLEVSHVSVYNWINRYVGLMQEYLQKIQPNVSNVWRTDELYLKISGETKYLYALMDDQTRFWIAQQIAHTKYTQDIRPLFREGRKVAAKKPALLISDGARNFHRAWKREFADAETKHIRHIHLDGDRHNNKMERMNGEIRDREKTMRGLKKKSTVVMPGYQLYHNYFREHEGLDGLTPAEAANIRIEGSNKWMTVIQNAAKERVN